MLQAPPNDAEALGRGWPQGAGNAPGWNGAAPQKLAPFDGLQPGAPALREAASSFLGPEADNVLRAIAKRKDCICPERLTPSARQFQKEVYDMVTNISSLPGTLSGQIKNIYLTLAIALGAEDEPEGLLSPAASSQDLDPARESPPPETSPFEIGVQHRMRFRLI